MEQEVTANPLCDLLRAPDAGQTKKAGGLLPRPQTTRNLCKSYAANRFIRLSPPDILCAGQPASAACFAPRSVA